MNVGDRVYISVNFIRANKNIKYRDTGTILDKRNGLYLVEFDRDIEGHDGCNQGKFGHCCWLNSKKIRKVVR